MAQIPLDQGIAVLTGRARVARVALMSFIVASVGMLLVELGQVTGVVNLEAAEIDDIGLAAVFVALAYFIALMASITLVAMWIYRGHANLWAANAEGISVKPGWSVGSYFIPFVNLVVPYQNMQELMRSSSAIAGGGPSLGLWWGCWVGGDIIANIGSRIESIPEAGGVQVGAGVGAVGTVLLIGAAFVLLAIIRSITQAQQSGLGISETFA